MRSGKVLLSCALIRVNCRALNRVMSGQGLPSTQDLVQSRKGVDIDLKVDAQKAEQLVC
jgi:hypothetical protein